MRIKATIHVEYDVSPEKYHYLAKENQEESIRAVEIHSLCTAVAEAMPWPDYGQGQVLKVELEK